MTALDMARSRSYDKDIDALEAAPDESAAQADNEWGSTSASS